MLKETLLFALLSPGLLFTLASGSKKTSFFAVILHACLFAGILYYSDRIPILNQIEGFEGDIYCNKPSVIWAIAIGSMLIGAVLTFGLTFILGRVGGSKTTVVSSNV